MTDYQAKIAYLPTQPGPIQMCDCHYCGQEWQNLMDEIDPDDWRSNANFMVLCPECGNKRCPRATYHGHDCTGSNRAGQELSVYGGFVLPNSPEDDDDPDDGEPEWVATLLGKVF